MGLCRLGKKKERKLQPLVAAKLGSHFHVIRASAHHSHAVLVRCFDTKTGGIVGYWYDPDTHEFERDTFENPGEKTRAMWLEEAWVPPPALSS
jgi:hypothetical protein